MSEIRYDLLEDNYVIIAPERLQRPAYNMAWKKEENIAACPFCEGNESMTPPEIFAIRDNDSFPDEPGWKSRVIPNLYKAVQIEAPYGSRHKGMSNTWEGFGAHEIIIDTSEHFGCMADWTKETFVQWIYTLQQRVADLRHDDRIAFISLFKNH